MLRRTFVAVVTACLLALPLRVATGQPAKVPRIGYVSPAASFDATPALRAFFDELRNNGYIEGRDLIIEFRSTQGRQERFAALSAELSQLPVDVLLVGVCGEPLDARVAQRGRFRLSWGRAMMISLNWNRSGNSHK